MPIDRLPPLTLPKPTPRRHRDDPAAAEVWTDKPDITPHLARAIDEETASIQAVGLRRSAKAEEDFAATVTAIVDRLPDPTLRGLIHHARTLTESAGLTDWRQAFPKAFGGLSDEEASAVIRFAVVAAEDETVMPEHFGRRPLARVRPAAVSGAAGGIGSGPGLPLKAGGGGAPVQPQRGPE